MQKIKASLLSISAYHPKHSLSNFDLEKMVDTSDDWIVKRTGIKNRYIAKQELSSDMGFKAAKIAIQRANIQPKDLDAIICATISPDHMCMPSTACKVANLLGLRDIMAFDISAACTGFIYLIEIAKSMIESGLKRNILIIGCEKLSSIVNWKDRTTCVLFGDGAGAAVVGVSRDDNCIIDVHTSSDGSKYDLLITPGPGCAYPADTDNFIKEKYFIHMSGNEVFKIAVNTLCDDVINILNKNNISSKDVDLFIPHQANLRIIKAVQQKLGLSDKQCVITVDKFGNTSSASIPMAMNYAFETNLLKNGSLILLDAFGGGFTWGSAIIKFGGDNIK